MTETKSYVIVAAVDYSSAGDLALERALDTAVEKEEVALHVINVLPVYQAGTVSPTLGDEAGVGSLTGALPTVTEASEQLKAYTERKLEEYRLSHKGADLSFMDTVVAHQRVDVPSEEIARLAAELEADLVVVGTHGRRGISRLILGSVAEAVVRLAPCPVLVVRPKEVPDPGPAIEPPCARCVEARELSAGRDQWCAQHSERHGQRHTYHQGDRSTDDGTMPLFVRSP